MISGLSKYLCKRFLDYSQLFMLKSIAMTKATECSHRNVGDELTEGVRMTSKLMAITEHWVSGCEKTEEQSNLNVAIDRTMVRIPIRMIYGLMRILSLRTLNCEEGQNMQSSSFSDVNTQQNVSGIFQI